MQVLRAQIMAFRSIKSAHRRQDEARKAGKGMPLLSHDDMCPLNQRLEARPIPLQGSTAARPSDAVLVSAPARPPILGPQDFAPGVSASIGKSMALLAAAAAQRNRPQASPTPPPQQSTQQNSAALLPPPPAAAASSMLPAASPVPAQEPSAARQDHSPLYSITPSMQSNAQMPLVGVVGPLLSRMGTQQLARRREALRAQLEAQRTLAKAAKRPMPLQARLRMAKLKAWDKQTLWRKVIEGQQSHINALQDRKYRAFARSCSTLRDQQERREDASKRELLADRLKGIKACKGAMADRSNAARDGRVARNRNIQRAHERLARNQSKARGDDRAQRMEALKANDFEAYQELLQKEHGGGTAPGQRYKAISRFLNETEDYLNNLTTAVAKVKAKEEAEEAAGAAQRAARLMGCTDEEVAAATAAALREAEQAIIRKHSDSGGASAQERYYALAHSVGESITEQPRMLVPPNNAKLRKYQLVGLQWMVSLYNNRLNGILADEMGLGKTVQVMALLAYLKEQKNNAGPHLIIVPNAVMVNWKAELIQWLPAMRCVYYVGNKDERSQIFISQVFPITFNILVTTYEFIMRDRAKLASISWQYMVIDEAQRMKDNKSKLSRDMEKFTAQRRLLLTGTPLQNDLSELWSLLNLLLPKVFDNKESFAQWFDTSSSTGAGAGADDGLEGEQRVVVIHRLHQILEPFMLRRQVEDVESKLPPKIAHTVKVAMTPYQAVIYAWVVHTGTLRSDPEAPAVGNMRRPYVTLNNKCMELRKVCNHPKLSYPYVHTSVDAMHLVSQGGKLLVLDRMLVKLHASGHRVLLFSTMTKLLDLLEEYVTWRRVPDPAGSGRLVPLEHLRIDGGTSLDGREQAIRRFNAPDSKAFLFLLSIRAAGRGLNLQSADTVVIYDPDANPKNEEQAIARSHRIGQKKEVRVFHLEAVADAPDVPAPSQTAAALEGQGEGRRYADSVESLVRNNIQRAKIDMANEVIDAGRFDMQTTTADRKIALETLLQDEERTKVGLNEVPSVDQVNIMMARSPEELELFRRLDHELDWPQAAHDVPAWLRFTIDQADLVASDKLKPAQVAELKRQEAARAAGRPVQEPAQQPAGVTGPSKAKRRARQTVSYQMSAASTGITTESDADDAAHAGDADDMEEEYVGANIREESEAPQAVPSSEHMDLESLPDISEEQMPLTAGPAASMPPLQPSALPEASQPAKKKKKKRHLKPPLPNAPHIAAQPLNMAPVEAPHEQPSSTATDTPMSLPAANGDARPLVKKRKQPGTDDAAPPSVPSADPVGEQTAYGQAAQAIGVSPLLALPAAEQLQQHRSISQHDSMSQLDVRGSMPESLVARQSIQLSLDNRADSMTRSESQSEQPPQSEPRRSKLVVKLKNWKRKD